ncbi:MAG: hypothetical protein AAGJ32_08285 [Pseudomonadota bacterium]
MSRKMISFMVAVMAVAFAFGAMAAIRWPSILMLVGLFTETGMEDTLEGFNWREFGILHGIPYFIAAMAFYTSAALIAKRKPGALNAYLLGGVTGFPAAMLVDFEPGWWRDPSTAEGIVAGGCAIALLLLLAVWDLRFKRRPPRAVALSAAVTPGSELANPGKPKPRRPAGPPSAAVMATRAQFARDGQKMLAQQKKARQRQGQPKQATGVGEATPNDLPKIFYPNGRRS